MSAARLPHEDVEKDVLGALMHTPRAIEEVTSVVEAGDFYAPRHELVYAAITALHSKGVGVDPVTVAAELARRGDLAQAGGLPYLADLYAAPPTTANVGYYARLVRDQAVQRRLHAAGTRIAQLAESGEGDIDELVEHARAEVDAVSRATAATGWVASSIDDTIEELDAPAVFFPTPWDALNTVIGGWAPGRLYVLGARPAVGKSLVAINAATHIAQHRPVALNTLEMSEYEVHLRIIANLASVNLTHLIEHRLTPDDWDRVSRARARIADLRLSVDDRPEITTTEVASHARTTARQAGEPLGAVVVDYLQLMSAKTGRRREHENRQQEVAAFSRSLKILARTQACPVIALSQLNRTAEGRADRRPTMSDLRESGALEQDADVVILLHVDEDDPSTLHVAIPKNRHGETKSFELQRIGHFARITNQVWTPTSALGGAA